MNDVEMIIGQPLLFNYYTMFDVRKGKIGFYHTSYTETERQITLGAVFCFGIFGLITGAGVVSCWVKCRRKELENKVTVKEKKEKNKMKQVEEGILPDDDSEALDEINSSLISTQ
jgi:hypothetical protein